MALVEAARPGGMLIFHQLAVRTAMNGPEDPSIAHLREALSHHDDLVVADIDWSGGLLIATKRYYD